MRFMNFQYVFFNLFYVVNTKPMYRMEKIKNFKIEVIIS